MRNLMKVGFFIAILVCFLAQPLYAADTHNLVSSKVGAAPKIDGSGSDAEWKGAKKVAVEAEDGPEITVQSVHTDSEIFFLIQVVGDLDHSINMDQWVYDGSKWTVKQEERIDEKWAADTDRFGFQWPITDATQIKKNIKGKEYSFVQKGCATICHSPEKEDKMYLLGAGQKTDVWLWKSSLTNPLNYADDWFQDSTNTTVAQEADKPKRVAAAQKGDEALGYVQNKDGDKPKWMPKEGPNKPFLVKGDEVPLDMSKIKKGDTIPGWLLSRPKGSGGDVNAAGKYDADEAAWTLEFGRKLKTGDAKNDVQFDTGKSYYFGIANWDNDRLNKHTRVKKPFLLSFK